MIFLKILGASVLLLAAMVVVAGAAVVFFEDVGDGISWPWFALAFGLTAASVWVAKL